MPHPPTRVPRGRGPTPPQPRATLTMIDDVSSDSHDETAFSMTLTWTVTLPPTDAVRARRARGRRLAG